MKLTDNLLNWLQIKLLAVHRPDDLAARDTVAFFAEMLEEDHGISVERLRYELHEDVYEVYYPTEEGEASQRFDRFAVDRLWLDVQSEPRFGQ